MTFGLCDSEIGHRIDAIETHGPAIGYHVVVRRPWESCCQLLRMPVCVTVIRDSLRVGHQYLSSLLAVAFASCILVMDCAFARLSSRGLSRPVLAHSHAYLCYYYSYCHTTCLFSGRTQLLLLQLQPAPINAFYSYIVCPVRELRILWTRRKRI